MKFLTILSLLAALAACNSSNGDNEHVLIHGSVATNNATSSATNIIAKVKSVWVSKTNDCANPIPGTLFPGLVPSKLQGVFIDVFFPKGSYECLIIGLDRNLTFNVNQKSAETVTECSDINKSYTSDLFQGITITGNLKDLKGNNIDSASTQYLFITTDNTAPVAAPEQIVQITDPVTSSNKLKLEIDTAGLVQGSSGNCVIDQPSITVTNL